MSKLEPVQNESPLAFVERADALGADEDAINTILTKHFGMCDDGEIKTLKLKSSAFWEGFYLTRVRGIFESGGSRYAAHKFIQRKNGVAGQRMLTEKEINKLVNSVGVWTH